MLELDQTARLYIQGEKDVTNPPTNVANGFKIGAKRNDILYLNVNVGGAPTTFTSPILMPVPLVMAILRKKIHSFEKHNWKRNYYRC